MRTKEDTRQHLYDQAVKILPDFAKIGLDTSKIGDLEQFLWDYITACDKLQTDGRNSEIPESLAQFNRINKSQLGDLLQPWSKDKQPVITCSIGYKGKIFSEFNIEIDKDEDEYSKVLNYAHRCLDLILLESFINPKLRTCTMKEPTYEGWANNYFNNISENTGYIMMEMIRDHYKDFYKFLTEKKEIPKLEELKDWMKTKKELKESASTN